MSKMIDRDVIEAIQRRGFRLDPSDPLETRWIDEHGHVLTELQLANETAESIDELIDWFHPE